MKKLCALFLCLFVALSLATACATQDKPLTAGELLSLGEKYLLEMDYEQALVHFTKLIEVEPMNPRGYTGAAEVYVTLRQYDNAVVILQKGYDLTGNPAIEQMLQHVLDEYGANASASQTDSMVDNDINWSNSIHGNIIDLGDEITYHGYRIRENRWNVGINDKYGCADKNGNIIIPIIYDYIGSFQDGIAEARIDGKSGLIDKDGNIVLPIEFDVHLDFVNGFAVARKDDKEGIVSRTGEIIIPIEYDECVYEGHIVEWQWPIRVCKDNKYGFIDSDGTIIAPPIYDRASTFSDGVATVENEGKDTAPEDYAINGMNFTFHLDGLSTEIGIIDTSGQFILPLRNHGFHGIGSFHDGLAHAGVYVPLRSGSGNWDECFVDKAGNIVLQLSNEKYVRCSDSFRDSLLAVSVWGDRHSSRYNITSGFINKSGDFVIPAIYDYVEDFYKGAALVKYGTDDDIGCELINTKGEILIPMEYTVHPFPLDGNDNLFSIEKDGKHGLADYNGTIVLPAEHDNPIAFYGTGLRDVYYEYCAVRKHDKYGVINIYGELVIPYKYERILDPVDRYMPVKEGGMYGLLTIHEDIAIPFEEYELFQYLGEGVVLAKKDGQYIMLEAD